MKTQKTPFCSIIVLNYYGEKILKANIESILALDYPQDSYEIIVVDNNSKDRSRKIIKSFSSKYTNIRSLFFNKNLGFAKANNIGVKAARGKYVALLNNDCLVDKNWLKELVTAAEKDKKIFAVNSKIVLYNTKKIQNAGIMVFHDGYGRDIGAIVKYQSQDYEIDNGQYDKETKIYAACGAAVLFRKQIFDEIGYLDEDFFMYYEDVEISERARLHGYYIIYCPKAIVYHHHALSSIEWSPKFIFNTEKGRLLHIFHNFPFRVFLTEYDNFFILAVLRFFGRIFRIKEIGKNLQYINISLYFIFNLPRLILKRINKNTHYLKNAVENNYQQILSGDWYFLS